VLFAAGYLFQEGLALSKEESTSIRFDYLALLSSGLPADGGFLWLLTGDSSWISKSFSPVGRRTVP